MGGHRAPWCPVVATEPIPFEYGAPMLPERIWSKIRVTDSGCWEWTACKYFNGYGQTWAGERLWRIHRLVYTVFVGPIPDGYDLDHYLWPDGGCVGPACGLHTRPVTRWENLLRGQTMTARNRALEACPRGHPYAGPNLYVDPGGGRRCRECRRILDRLREERRRSA